MTACHLAHGQLYDLAMNVLNISTLRPTFLLSFFVKIVYFILFWEGLRQIILLPYRQTLQWIGLVYWRWQPTAAARDGGGSAALQQDIYRAQSAAIRGKQTAVMMTHCSVTTLCLLTMLQCCSQCCSAPACSTRCLQPGCRKRIFRYRILTYSQNPV